MDIVENLGNAAEWDKYVQRSETATFYHQIGWKNVIEKTFGHKSYYLIAKENEELKGILPLFLIKSRLFGSSLVSLPFVDYGGVVAESGEISKKLIDKAIEIAKENEVDYLELRHIKRIEDERLLVKTTKTSFILPLNPDPEIIWEKALHQNKRNKIRKANKYLNVYIGNREQDILKCNKVFSKAMRELGTPTYPKEFLQNIVETFSDQTIIFLVNFKEKVIGAKIAFVFKDMMIFLLHYSLREYFKFAPNDLLYWTAIKYACEKGYKICDFGRCTVNSRTFEFKKKFRGEQRQLYYQYYLNNTNELPDLAPSSKKYRLAISIWKKLPLFITKIVGPKIVKNIP